MNFLKNPLFRGGMEISNQAILFYEKISIKMKGRIPLISVISFTLAAISVKTQPCTKEKILKQPGYWTPWLEASKPLVAATDFSRPKTIAELSFRLRGHLQLSDS